LQVVNPSFDPKTNTWYLEDHEAEAPTIRGLLGILGPQYRVANYFPRGYSSSRKATGGSVAKYRYDHDAILNLWVEGYSAPQIAKKLNIKNWRRVTDTIWRKRKLNDPRATTREHHNRRNSNGRFCSA
jgi:hypothetical protein